MTDNNNLKGLGGWLILVGIGVVIGPFRSMAAVMPLYYELFKNGSIEVLTTPGSSVYHPMWGPLLTFEILFNLLMILASFYLIYLFFAKSYFFPKLYILVVFLSAVFVPFDAWLVSFILTEEPIFDPVTKSEMLKMLPSVIIWVPYMLFSKRVKVTFVEKKPNKSGRESVSEAECAD